MNRQSVQARDVGQLTSGYDKLASRAVDSVLNVEFFKKENIKI